MMCYTIRILFMAKKISSSLILFGGAAVVVVGLIVYVATRPSVPQSYYTFAQCLTNEKVTMYGAWWCPHCAAQKQLFGSSFKNINYVECSEPDGQTQTPACKAAGITSYPTWQFADGTRVEGDQTFDQLAQKSGGCTAPTP